MNRLSLGLATMGLFGAASIAQAAPMFMDDFNTVASAANYIKRDFNLTAVTYGFDYSTLNIPVAPNTTDNTTLGVKFEANMAPIPPATGGAIAATTLHTVAQYTGRYRVKFDAWINANGPFPAGGTGSTELLTAGVGGDGLTANRSGTGNGSGGWTAETGEGGATRDYQMFKNGGEQFAESGQFAAGNLSAPSGGAHSNAHAYYSGFGSIDVGALGQGGVNQTGTTSVGTFGFEWHEVELIVDPTGGTGGASSVAWYIDGLRIGTLDAGVGGTSGVFSTNGSVTIGYWDFASSISNNATYSFGLIDNLMIIPEPSSLVLLSLGLLGAIAWVRRK